MRSNPFLLCSSRFSPTVWGLKDTAWAGEGHGWSTAGVSIALRRSISVQYCFIGSCPLLGAVEKLIWVSASTSAQILPVIWFKLQAPAPAGELLPSCNRSSNQQGSKTFLNGAAQVDASHFTVLGWSCSALLHSLNSNRCSDGPSVVPGPGRVVTLHICISCYPPLSFEGLVLFLAQVGFCIQKRYHLKARHISLLNQHLRDIFHLICSFFRRYYLQAFPLPIFWLSTVLGGVFFLELSVAMAKCSSQPCFSMDKPSWALWVEAGKQLRAKSWYLSIRKVASYWFNPSGKHGFGSVLFSFCLLCWKSIHINYLYWIHRYQ